jgi:hypothetical protein
MAMMIHTTSQPDMKKAAVAASNNGCLVKTVRYIGRASHAGGAPHMGINALYAANIGLSAINAIRETFRDEDSIRVHPIFTHGGSQVNVIPGESASDHVRGKTVKASRRQPGWTARSAGALRPKRWRSGAARLPPLFNHMGMGAVQVNAAAPWAETRRRSGHRSGRTDMGDIPTYDASSAWVELPAAGMGPLRDRGSKLAYVEPPLVSR